MAVHSPLAAHKTDCARRPSPRRGAPHGRIMMRMVRRTSHRTDVRGAAAVRAREACVVRPRRLAEICVGRDAGAAFAPWVLRRGPRCRGTPRSRVAAGSFDPQQSGNSLPIAKKSYERVSARDREAALSALDALGSRVTIGDVARKSGLDIAVVEDVMRDIAADADGFSLEVSDAGDLVYVKPRGMASVRAALMSKSALLRLEPLGQKAAGIVSYLVRVSFGSALVLSVVLVYTSIFVLLTSQQRSDNDNRRGSYGRSPMMMRGFYLNPFDVFWYWDPFYYRNYRARIRRNGKYNFLEAVFSFVFGDGDPNEDYDNARWEAIGRLISTCDGVVTAEQLAPYTDSAPLLVGGADVGIANDEGFVLPVLQRFGGVPEVDSKGNIFYRFPDLQKTARASGKQRRLKNQLPGFNLEKKWAFSEAEFGQLVGAAALGAVNLFGVFYLSGILRGENLMSMVQYYGGVVMLASDLLPFLKVYAASFFVIPLLRWLWIKNKNMKIDSRNEVKLQNADYLLQSPASRQKLMDASRLASEDVISRDRIVFKSNETIEDMDLNDFDEQLKSG